MGANNQYEFNRLQLRFRASQEDLQRERLRVQVAQEDLHRERERNAINSALYEQELAHLRRELSESRHGSSSEGRK
jgi:hypothetical protein